MRRFTSVKDGNMNFFGIGGAELVLIILIMLIVAGPKRMLRWSYILGVYAGKARDLWAQTATMLQKELDDAGTGITLPKTPPTRRDITRMVSEAAKPYTQDLENTWKETQSAVTIQPPKKAIVAKTAVKNDAPAPVSPAKTEPSLGAWGSADNATPSGNDALGTWSNSKGDA